VKPVAAARPYELYYWPGLPGRGEFVRLALEAAGAPYVDVARLAKSKGGGVAALLKALGRVGPAQPFAPPFLKSGALVIAQTANILLYLGPRHGLVPRDEASRFHAHQIQLTIADLVSEVHDTHHPTAVDQYYEDQKPAAKKRATAFLATRLPKYLGWLERIVAASGGTRLVGRRLSYPDLSAFQLLAGLDYAFPKAMKRESRRIPRLRALAAGVAKLPRIAAYLESERRTPFNQTGIFRHYPELDR
jgi:glutathione S-transferase